MVGEQEDLIDLGLLRAGCQVAHLQVLRHALPKWWHGNASLRDWNALPRASRPMLSPPASLRNASGRGDSSGRQILRREANRPIAVPPVPRSGLVQMSLFRTRNNDIIAMTRLLAYRDGALCAAEGPGQPVPQAPFKHSLAGLAQHPEGPAPAPADGCPGDTRADWRVDRDRAPPTAPAPPVPATLQATGLATGPAQSRNRIADPMPTAQEGAMHTAGPLAGCKSTRIPPTFSSCEIP